MPTTRHLSVVHCGSLNQISRLKNLRTLIIQSESYLDEEAEYALQDVLMMSVRLRLLYLYVPSLSHALHKLGTLTHLRYLFLFSCDRYLIILVHRLYHLKVLKINYFTDKEEYFSCIPNLRSLHCLHAPENIMSSKILNTRMLTRLQQLHVFSIAENDGQRLMALRNLTALRQI